MISKITLTTKRNKRKLPRMEIAVTTCGVMSLERIDTKPISNARSVTKPMKRVQEKRWTCLGAGTLEGTLSCWEAVLSTPLKDGEWRSVGIIWWFISESVWWFKSNNKILRQGFEKYLTSGAKYLSWLLISPHSRCDKWCLFHSVYSFNGRQIVLLDDQDYRSCEFGVEVFVLWTCCKVVREMVVGKDALHRLIAEENGSEFLR